MYKNIMDVKWFQNWIWNINDVIFKNFASITKYTMKLTCVFQAPKQLSLNKIKFFRSIQLKKVESVRMNVSFLM